MHRKYTPEQEAEFLKLRAGGKSLSEAAKLVGVPLATCVKWNGKNKRAKEETAAASNLTLITVPKPPAGSGGAAEGAGAKGAEGARQALEGEEEIPEETEPGEEGGEEKTEEEKKPEDPPMDPGQVLVDLCKLGTWLIVRGYALRYKLKLDGELADITTWSEEEETTLRQYAGPTARLMGAWLLTVGVWIAPAFFAFNLTELLGARLEKIKERAAKEGKLKPKKEKPKGNNAPQDGEREGESDQVGDPMPNGYTPTTSTTEADDIELLSKSFYRVRDADNGT